MTKLLKCDLARVIKDKLFLVVCILGVVFALINPLIYKLLFSALDVEAGEIPMLAVNSKINFFGSFSLSNNLGPIAPILIAIVLCKDFSFGTVRNKLISGKRRSQVLFSMFVTGFVYIWAIMLLHALLTLAVSLMFFEYQPGGFSMSDLWYALISVGLQALVFLFVAAFVSWLCVAMKNVGLVIVMYIAFIFGLSMITAILQVGITFIGADGGHEILLKALKFVQNINVMNISSVVGTGTEYKQSELLYFILSPLIGTALMLLAGVIKFNKKDIK